MLGSEHALKINRGQARPHAADAWRGEDGTHMQERKHLSIRMDQRLHDKFQYVAAYEGRSMSRQVLHLMLSCVREFEREHGEIPAGQGEEDR